MPYPDKLLTMHQLLAEIELLGRVQRRPQFSKVCRQAITGMLEVGSDVWLADMGN